MDSKFLTMIEENPSYKGDLFVRGYMISSKKFNEAGYPFYNNWKINTVLDEKYYIYCHKMQNVYVQDIDNLAFVMVGHAYNPFTDEFDENQILESLNQAYSESFASLLNKIDELTGLFSLLIFDNDRVFAFTDASGMYCTYYGTVKGDLYFTSHFQMVADLCDLEQSNYVKELKAYRFYPKYGNFLPGDISAYDEIKRLVPNTYIEYKHNDFGINRLYPREGFVDHFGNCCSYEEKIEMIGQILHKNLELVQKKWKNPAISLTGGMDSKTTLASANGLYDGFKYFSYISMPGEKIDADAAHTISEHLNIDHKIYEIDQNKVDRDDIDITKAILVHNFGEIGSPNDNDVLKRIYFKNNDDFDVEVKSWVSEIGRANYYKKFGMKKMPNPLSYRQMSSMYKVFLWQRKLLSETDNIFKQYCNDIDFGNGFTQKHDPSDMYLWEFRYGSWGGMVITCEHMYSFDITIPYNNRLLLDLMLSLPLAERISDKAHEDIIKCMNRKIDETGITITNYNETKKRMYIEKAYFIINSLLPF